MTRLSQDMRKVSNCPTEWADEVEAYEDALDAARSAYRKLEDDDRSLFSVRQLSARRILHEIFVKDVFKIGEYLEKRS